MESTVDHNVSDPPEPSMISAFKKRYALDVPSKLANRIGELWASEERLHRQERTERILRESAQPSQD
jgi:hypothetical protein